MKDEFSGSAGKVPLLGDIPLIGHLFRSDSRTREKTNLMVFLRPVVMRTQQAADNLTMDRYDSIRALQRESQPTRSVLIPVNEAPVLPELRPREPAPSLAPVGGPIAAPAPAPATAPAADNTPPRPMVVIEPPRIDPAPASTSTVVPAPAPAAVPAPVLTPTP